MKKAVIYARYSCERQNETSIEGQLDVCYNYAKNNGYTIIHEYIDRATSGRTDKRDSFQEMLFDASDKKFEAVIVYKLDRFSRNRYEEVIHEKHLNDNGISLLSAMENVNDQAESIILKSLMVGLSEYYSVELSQKVSRTFKIMREQGMWLGGKVPYGYKIVDKKYVINEEQARNVRTLFNEVINGSSPHSMQIRLGIPVDCTNIIRSVKYKGCLIHNGELLENVIPPIVDNEVWELANNKIQAVKHHSYYRYNLSGKVFCGTCGTAYKGECCFNKMKKKYRYYVCQCDHDKKRINVDKMETLIAEKIKELITTESAKRIAERTIELLKQKTDTSYRDNIEKQLKSVSRSKNAIIDTITKVGALDELTSKLTELKNQELELKAQLENAKDIEISYAEIIKFFNVYLNSDMVNSEILKYFVKRVDVYPDHYEITCGNYTNKCSPENVGGVPLATIHELLLFPNSVRFKIAC